MNITDEVLMAYADGELDAVTRQQIESEIASNPTLAKQVEKHRSLRTQLSGAFDSVLAEPIPDKLRSLMNASNATSLADISSAREARAIKKIHSRAAFQWASIAASVIVGVLIGIFAFGNRGSEVVIASADGLLAKGKLARGLSEELASRPNKNSPVQIGVSYLAKSGEYCRSFVLNGIQNLSGLACRSDNAWNIHMLVRAEQSAAAYRTAASSIPASVLDQVNLEMDQAPLDAEAESQAAANNWLTDK